LQLSTSIRDIDTLTSIRSSDKIAEYGLPALATDTAAAAAVKLGFFKALWVAILAAKKFIMVGVIAIAASVRKLFKRKQTPA